MYSLPSTSQTLLPDARARKSGSPPTAPQERAGLFTPPGIIRRAVSYSWVERSRFNVHLADVGNVGVYHTIRN